MCKRAATALAMLVALLLASSCGREGDRERLAGRLIDADPEILLPRDDLFLEEPLFAWTFESAADLEPWIGSPETADPETAAAADASADALTERGWRLEAPSEEQGGALRLERALGPGVDAAELHELQVEISGVDGAEMTLFWAARNEDFDAERSLESAVGRRGPAVFRTFDLAGHRLWDGGAARLMIELRGLESPVELQEVRGLKRKPRPETLAERLGQSWKIDIDADVRNAWLAVPGLSEERRVTVGEDQRLRISYALEPAVQDAVDFVISEGALEAAGGQTSSEPGVLWRRRLEPADAGRWHEARIELERFAGREVLLRFETRSPATLDLARGFPVWANPEILEPARAGAESGLPNVILISLDTLRSDRMSTYGHGKPTTPNIDRWAERSAVLFENAVAQAPWTLPSHASMFTGLEALRHDVNHFGEAPASLEMLAETLRGAGYTTAAITGGGYLRPQFGFAQGFDVFRYWPHLLSEPEFDEGSDRLLEWLRRNRSRRFFMLFHTYEIHFPFRRRQPYFDRFRRGEPTEGVRGKIGLRARPLREGGVKWNHDYFVVTLPSGEEVEHLNEQEKQLLRTMYDSGIAYVDDRLGELFAELERLGLDERTLVILTSDHGEALAEGDRGGHNYLYDWNVMVPLIMAFPDGFGAGRRVEAQVRSIDIVPTVLETLGLEPPRSLDGVSLRPLIAPGGSSESATAEMTERATGEAWSYASSANVGLGLRHRNQLKYVFDNTAWSPYLGGERLYDLRRDPQELEERSAEDPAAAERLRSRVRRAIDEQHEGLRLELRHGGGGGVLRGWLKGAWGNHARVKAADAACDCVYWQRGAHFSLEPGDEVTLYFESIAAPRVVLEVEYEREGEPAVKHTEAFQLDQLEAPQLIALEDAGWRRSAGSTTPEIGFRLWNAGQRPKARAPGPRDRETLDQLGALGYIDP